MMHIFINVAVLVLNCCLAGMNIQNSKWTLAGLNISAVILISLVMSEQMSRLP